MSLMLLHLLPKKNLFEFVVICAQDVANHISMESYLLDMDIYEKLN